jgi:MEDS: MEthanogen/methylotroph, DcmR Sensory domain
MQVRGRGIRFELLRMQPHDHVGWVYQGSSEFAALAVPYLSEGAALGEKLVYIAEEPDPDDLSQLDAVVDAGTLQIASVAEIYGSDAVIDPPSQLATFMAVLADAKAAGYTGVRVAADNSSLVGDEKRMKAWIQWEIVADHTAAGHDFTALCAFSKDRVREDVLRQIAAVHPLSSASGPIPQFRLFSDGQAMHVEGRVDAHAITQLWLALETLPERASVVLDLATARLMGPGVLAGLTQLCDCGIGVTIRGEDDAISALRDSLTRTSERLVLEESRGA